MPQIRSRRRRVGAAALATATLCTVFGLAPAATAAPAGTTSAAQPPTDVRGFAGGDSIAVLWEPAKDSTPVSYQVYREGVPIGAEVPPTTGSHYKTVTARFYDTDVEVGKTYKYQVEEKYPDGTVSPLSEPIWVTQLDIPVPEVEIKVTKTGDDLAPMLDHAKELIRTWYPKFAAVLAVPDYVAPPSMSVTTAQIKDAGTVWKNTEIVFGEDNARAHLNDPDFDGTILHENAHVLQGGNGGWLPEGLAVWTTHEIFHDADTPVPTSGQNFTDGYDPAAYLIQWLATQTRRPWPTAAHDLNVAWFTGGSVSADAVVAARTGLTYEHLWLMATRHAVDLKVLSDNGLCIDNDFARTDDGNPLKLGECWDTSAQQFTFLPDAEGGNTGALLIQDKCVDASGQVEPNARVVIRTCAATPSQRWTFTANGSLQNGESRPGYAMCVQPIGWATEKGNPLELFWCDANSRIQHWNRQPL